MNVLYVYPDSCDLSRDLTTVLLSNKTDTLDSYDLSSIEHLSVFGNSYVSLDVQLLTNMKSLTLGNSNCTAVLSGTVPNLEELYLQSTRVQFILCT